MQTPFARLGRPGLLLLLGGALLAGGGCFSMWGGGPRKTTRSSSVVNYLYPGEANPLPPTDVPVLRLPLRVGIAFVPSGATRNYYQDSAIPEVQKTALMERVAAEFKGREYIQSIEIIPSSYLRPAGGFANLNQVRGLLGVDVVALVAYDQVQFTSENILSFAYWTIVGAYIFQGNKNDTDTLMEAAVYDIASRHLLFRAPGTSHVEGGAAAAYVEQRKRADAGKGLDVATDDMIKNLKAQLEAFRERVKNAPAGQVARIEHRPGYKGGGSFGGAFVVALLLLGGVRWWRRHA
jgi:rhombotail lipoprotein